MPERDKKCIESWKKFCPDYEIKEWNEHNFNVSENRYALESYKAKKYGLTSDYVRFKVIYENGGIYLDTDVELLKPLDPFLNHSSFFGFEGPYVKSGRVYVNTGLGFGAEPRNEIVKAFLDNYENLRFKTGVNKFDFTPQPIRVTSILKEMGLEEKDIFQKLNGDNAFYPTEYFCPFKLDTRKMNITENTVSIHWFDGSWWGEVETSRLEKFAGRLIDASLGILGCIKDEGLFEYIKKRAKKYLKI